METRNGSPTPDLPAETVHDLAPLYALGALPEDEALRFEEHLSAGCPTCQAALATHRETLAELLRLPSPVPPPPSLRGRILETIRQESSGEETSPPEASGGEATPGEEPYRGGESPDSVQVWRRWQAPASIPQSFIVRQGEGGWEATGIRGIAIRRLFYDPEHDQVTMLVRMDPGTRYPSHRHAGAEECFVLQGDLHVGEETMHAGDYQRVERGSIHPPQSTDGGCVLFIVSSAHDEILV